MNKYYLNYNGKESEQEIINNTKLVSFQKVKEFGEDNSYLKNMLIFGDNLLILKTLITIVKATNN